jgi:lipase chaperone LimK
VSDCRVRTSLSHTDSGWTEEEKAARMKRLERELWDRHEAIVIRKSDPGMETIVSAIGQTRFGKREERA